MIITRKFGKIFRGKATPAQLMMAAILGTTVGFMPGLSQAPGLLAVLFLAAVILNANLALIGISTLLAGLLSIPLLPLTFGLGRFLLEGPLAGLFAFLINAPVLALFGFEYYVTTGGLVFGLVFGTLLGLGTVRSVRFFRQKMVDLDKNSEGWKRLHQRPWVKLFVWVFIGGGHGKLTYEDLLVKKGGSPFRPLGLVAAGLMVVVGFVVTLFLGDSIVRYVVQTNLERANGATVDLASAELRLREGRITLAGLAMADPEELRTDLFRAELIEADISQADLWRKRMHIDHLRVVEASTGESRRLPGSLTRPLPPAPKVDPEETEGRSLEDYLREAEKWRGRLAQLADWLERFSGSDKPVDGEPVDPEDEAARERRLREEGYRNAVATHLLRGSPTLLVSLASMEKMRVARMPEETFDLSGENLSTHPSLVEKAPRVVVRSSAESLLFDVNLASVAANRGLNTMKLVYLNVPVDSVAGNLRVSGQAPIEGGMLDFRTEGNWSASAIDLPLTVTVRNSRLSLPQLGETPIDELLVPIGLSGPLRNPRINFSEAAFADALAAAGKAEVARRFRAETDKISGQVEEKVGEELRARARSLLDGRLPGRK